MHLTKEEKLLRAARATHNVLRTKTRPADRRELGPLIWDLYRRHRLELEKIAAKQD